MYLSDVMSITNPQKRQVNMLILICMHHYDPCYGFKVINRGTEVILTKHPLDMSYKIWSNDKHNELLGTISEYDLGLHFKPTKKVG